MKDQDFSNDSQKKIQELQSIEQNLQMFIQQKQSMQIELNEVSNALSELESTESDEAYKILSGIMVKSSKDSLNKELTEKSSVLKSRADSIEKQIELLEKKSESLRKEISFSMAHSSTESKVTDKN